MKDDAKRLLSASQHAGMVVDVPADMAPNRHASIVKSWRAMGWVDDEGKLTQKCLSKRRVSLPDIGPREAVPEIPPVIMESETPVAISESIKDDDRETDLPSSDTSETADLPKDEETVKEPKRSRKRRRPKETTIEEE